MVTGVGRARLLATPLFSGLAAVAGVLLVGVGLGAEGTMANGGIPPLGEIFDYESINFVIAAIFGLSPAYLFDRIGSGNKLLDNLNSTKSAN
jgi:hypothetical protein